MSLKLTIRERIRANREESQNAFYQRCGNNNRSDNNPDLDPPGYLAYLSLGAACLGPGEE